MPETPGRGGVFTDVSNWILKMPLVLLMLWLLGWLVLFFETASFFSQAVFKFTM